MCGILASISKKAVSENKFKEALNSLSHRGPDSINYWLSKDKTVALGHTRLSIVDLEGGIQPLCDKEKEIYAIVNGEFYEYGKIKNFLESKGHQFSTNSDSEILIHLYKRYGVDCFKYLNGEFAFVVWDSRKQLIFAGKDRFGIKPLFYTKHNDSFYFASEIKAFKKLSVPFVWDLTNLNFSIVGQSLHTPFVNIYSIKPSHYMIVDRDNFQEVQYWQLSMDEQDESMDEQECKQELRTRLERAVNIRLKADVPVAHCLSGGIDSTVILSLIAKEQTNIDVFSVLFPHDKASDESVYIKEVVNYYNSRGSNIKLNTVEMNEDTIIDNFEKSVYFCEYPIVDFPVCAQLKLSKLIRNTGYKVVLSGQGSDEILGGYPWHVEDILTNQPNGKNFQQNLGSFLLDMHKSKRLDNFLLAKIKNILGHNGTKIILAMGMMSNEIVTIANFDRIIENYLEFFAKHPKKYLDKLSNSLYQDILDFLPSIPLNFRSDRVEMGYSVEGRTPYLDVNFVEFVAKIPSKLKINEGREKYILYETFKNEVPKIVYQRKKQAFLSSPIVSERWYSFIKDIVHDSSFLSIPVFNHEKVKSLFELEKAERDKYYMSFMAIANAYFLHKNFVK